MLVAMQRESNSLLSLIQHLDLEGVSRWCVWVNHIHYLKQFEQQFYLAVKDCLKTGPLVLFLDGLFSH